jgi:hypothetical protein
MLIKPNIIGTIGYMGGTPFNHENFTWCWGELVKYTTMYFARRDEEVHIVKATASYHEAARNELVSKMMGDWLLMLDMDHEYEPDLVVRMLDRMNRANVDAVTGFYVKRNPPHLPLLYSRNKSGNPNDPWQQLASWNPPNASAKVDGCGAGCLLVKRTVYERCIREFGPPFSVEPPYSEDISFCRRLSKMGVQILCDPRIQYRHLVTISIGREHFMPQACRLEYASAQGPVAVPVEEFDEPETAEDVRNP